MENKALDLELIEAQHVHAVIVSYDAGANDNLDKTAADAAFAKKILFDDAEYVEHNGGYRETSTSGGIATVAGTSTITITMAGAWEEAGPTKHIIPIVYFKGTRVPHVGSGGTNGITGWSGVTAAKTITIDNTAGEYSAVAADYEVNLLGELMPGALETVDAGGISLPYTTTNIKSLGYANPTFTKITKDGKQITGSLTYWEVANAIFNGSTLHNSPGEDVYAAIFGSTWNPGAANDLNYNTKPFAISIMQFAQRRLADDNHIGKVFCIEQRLYGCTLSNIPNAQNRNSGATEPVKQQIDFTAKQLFRRVRRVIAEPGG